VSCGRDWRDTGGRSRLRGSIGRQLPTTISQLPKRYRIGSWDVGVGYWERERGRRLIREGQRFLRAGADRLPFGFDQQPKGIAVRGAGGCLVWTDAVHRRQNLSFLEGRRQVAAFTRRALDLE